MNIQGFYTTKGLALAAKLAAGEKLTVTKVMAGSGTTAASALALADSKQTLTVGSATVSGQAATLPVTLAEASASSSYTLKELGVYATDPDDGEILFQVFRLSEGHAITAGGESIYRFYLKVVVGASGDGYNWSLYSSECSALNLNQVKCTQSVSSQDWGTWRFEYTKTIRAFHCTISNKKVAIDVIGSTVYLNNTVSGTGNTVSIRCGSAWGTAGGFVQVGGATVSGSQQKGFGGQIW